MEEKVIIVNKKAGLTPLECINEIKKERKEWAHLPLTYAGRLDPLATGVLIILIGDECQKKDEYLQLPKEYLVTVLFGFATDTYDLMGLVKENVASSELLFKRSSDEGDGSQSQTILNSNSDFASKLQKILPQFTGRIKQAYPAYSSRTVLSKPLFQWAREGRLSEITIPTHDVFVESIDLVSEGEISGKDLFTKIKEDIGKVSGDFRQTEIIATWRDVLKDELENKYKTITLKISCHSGVYVRSIAEGIGQALGVPSLALDIVRTKVGKYEIQKTNN